MTNSDFNATMYPNTTTTPNSSSSPQHHSSDDISLFLRQLLHRSSSQSQPYTSPTTSAPPMSTHAADHQPPCFGPSAVFTGSDRLVVDRFSHNAAVLPPSSASSGSFQFRSFDHTDFAEDNDYESGEEGNEVAVEEMDTKQQMSRCNHSKRTRAAEVHNLSEKRRRSRINEKMKALQNLIPNSNKTDKASMLDEAIEYLKQLQLQVQMLSMRNGLSLHPMCLPGGQGIMHPSQLSQMGIEFDNGSGSYDINVTNALNTMAESSNSMLNLPGQCTATARPSLTIAPGTMSFGPESCVPAFRPFQLRNSPQAVYRETSMPHEGLVIDNIETKSLASSSTRPFTFGIRDSSVKGHNPIEELVQQAPAPHGTFLENSGQDQLIISNIRCLQ